MGWDAFGLPAEQYAIRTGQHPRTTTEANIARLQTPDQIPRLQLRLEPRTRHDRPRLFQMDAMDFPQALQFLVQSSHGQSRTDRNTAPARRRRRATPFATATAWLTSAEAPVWWCEELGTVLANEEVIDGKSEVGGFPVTRRPMRQWMLRITAYAERLLAGLEKIDWSDSLKEMQRNWIGRSEGAEVHFPLAGSALAAITVFTTRPDTLFGATYMVLSPEHKLVDAITTPAAKSRRR